MSSTAPTRPRRRPRRSRTRVVALRKALGPETLVTRPPGYVLQIDREQIDARRFERELRRCAGGAGTSDGALERRSTSGAARRSPSSRSRTSRRPRPGASRSSVSSPSRSGSTPNSSSVTTPTSSASSSPWSLITRCGRPSGASRCSPCTARARQAEALGRVQNARAALERARASSRARAEAPAGRDPAPGGRARRAGAQAGASGRRRRDREGAPRRPDRPGARAGRRRRAWRAHRVGLRRADDDGPSDLARVSQYVATMKGSGPLYDELHRRFEAAVEPRPLHRFLARPAGAPARARRAALTSS